MSDPLTIAGFLPSMMAIALGTVILMWISDRSSDDW